MSRHEHIHTGHADVGPWRVYALLCSICIVKTLPQAPHTIGRYGRLQCLWAIGSRTPRTTKTRRRSSASHKMAQYLDTRHTGIQTTAGHTHTPLHLCGLRTPLGAQPSHVLLFPRTFQDFGSAVGGTCRCETCGHGEPPVLCTGSMRAKAGATSTVKEALSFSRFNS